MGIIDQKPQLLENQLSETAVHNRVHMQRELLKHIDIHNIELYPNGKLYESCASLMLWLKPTGNRTVERIEFAIENLTVWQHIAKDQDQKDFCGYFIYMLQYLKGNKEAINQVRKEFREWFMDEFDLN